MVIVIAWAMALEQVTNRLELTSTPKAGDSSPAFTVAALSPPSGRLWLIHHAGNDKTTRVSATAVLRPGSTVSQFIGDGKGQTGFILYAENGKCKVRGVSFVPTSPHSLFDQPVYGHAQSIAVNRNATVLYVCRPDAVSAYSLSRSHPTLLGSRPIPKKLRDSGAQLSISGTPDSRSLDLAWSDTGSESAQGGVERADLAASGAVAQWRYNYAAGGVPTLGYLSRTAIVAISFPDLVQLTTPKAGGAPLPASTLSPGGADPFQSLDASPDLGWGFAVTRKGVLFRLALSANLAKATKIGTTQPYSFLTLSPAGLCFARSTEKHVDVFKPQSRGPAYGFNLPEPGLLLVPLRP